jgi:phage terminase large subunit-like protein
LLRSLRPQSRQQIIASLTPEEQTQLFYNWRIWARPNQLPPDGFWFIWLLLAGRGFGKTRAGAEWIIAEARKMPRQRFALVGPTLDDVRRVMVNGDSGLLACSPPDFRPVIRYPSRPHLTWPNGTEAFSYSGHEPERLRGPQHHKAWCDEIRSWQYPQDTWDNLLLGLRLGQNPQVVVTTTPRPLSVLKDLLSRERRPGETEEDEGKDVVVTRGSTYENLANIAPSFRRTVIRRYEGTRLGRQELHAEMLEDIPGALWNYRTLEALRRLKAPTLRRIAIAIDPAVTATQESDETGIIVGGIGACDCKGSDKVEDHGFVLGDLSGRYSPNEWAQRAVSAYWQLRADVIVAEVNQGGDMVEATLRTIDKTVSYKSVRASRGKYTRAEPVAALYEQGRIHHIGTFSALEDQMVSFVPGEDFELSPDRADALVWLFTELFHLDDLDALDRADLWFR